MQMIEGQGRRSSLLGGLALLAAGVATLSGCGGSGGTSAAGTGSTGSTGSGGSSETTQVGEMRLTYSGVAKPSVNTSGSVSVTTMGGASLTTMAMIPNKTLSNSVIAAVGSNYSLEVYQNGVVNDVSTSTSLVVYAAGFTQDGRIGFMGYDVLRNSTALYVCNYDGSNVVFLVDVPMAVAAPTFSPDGTKFALITTQGSLVVGSSTGTGLKTIESAGAISSTTTWSSDSTRIIYSSPISGGSYVLESAPFAGGSTTGLAAFTANMVNPSYLVGGQYIGVTLFNSITFLGNIDNTNWSDVGLGSDPPSGSTDDHVAFAPDGKTVAFIRTGSSSASVLTTTLNFQNLSPIPFPDKSLSSLAWSPFFVNRSFVGPSGVMTTSAVGFVWSQLSDGFAGLCTYTASSPTGATVTEVGQPGTSGDLIYDLHAGAITGVQWTNGYYNPPLKGALTGTDALVTVSAASGQIETVVALAIGTDPKKAVTQTANGLTYTGKFTAFYTGDGVNHASNGASQVAYQPKSKTVQVLR